MMEQDKVKNFSASDSKISGILLEKPCLSQGRKRELEV